MEVLVRTQSQHLLSVARVSTHWAVGGIAEVGESTRCSCEVSVNVATKVEPRGRLVVHFLHLLLLCKFLEDGWGRGWYGLHTDLWAWSVSVTFAPSDMIRWRKRLRTISTPRIFLHSWK